MSAPPIKTCDYCGVQGTMPTYMDGETCCSACSRSLPWDIPSARRLVLNLRNQLEASQAREAQLREGIEHILNTVTTAEGAKAGCSILLLYPTDNTALKARLKAERERCAEAFSQWDRDGRWAAGVIRNLGDE